MKTEMAPPFDKSEMVPADDIGEVQRINLDLLKGVLQARANSFRAEAISMLIKHNAFHDREGWAIFQVGSEGGHGSTATINPDKRVLIMIKPCPPSVNPGTTGLSVVRIITNEPCVDFDGETQILGVDITLDYDNDAQYNIGATTAEDLEESHTPIFFTNEEGNLLLTGNFQAFTPVRSIELDAEDEQIPVFPFGHYSSPGDSLYAIEMATQILNEVVEIKPLCVYGST